MRIRPISQLNASYLSYLLLAATALFFIYCIVLEAAWSASPAGMVISRLGVALAEIAVWLIALISALRLRSYAASIRKHPDGSALHYIAWALLLTVPYVVLLSMRNVIAGLFRGSRYLGMVVFLRNEVPLILLLIAAILLFVGSLHLAHLTGKVPALSTTLIFAAVGCGCFLIFAVVFYRLESTALPIAGVPRFILSLPMLTLTYTVPHFAIWEFGMLSCLNIARYASFVSGKIYKVLFRSLYRGLLVVLVGIFMGQVGMISRFAGQQNSAGIVMAFGLVAVVGVGFTLVYQGAAALHKIEHASGQSSPAS